MTADLRYFCLCNCLSVTVLITGCTFLLILALPIGEITLGVVYLNECPASPVIPVYVILCGILAILLFGLIGMARYFWPSASENRIWTGCIIIVMLSSVIWFIYGSYLVYSIHPPNYIKSSNSSVLGVSAADHKPEPYNQNLQSLNQTGTIYQSNQTLLSLIQTLSRNSSAQVNREHLMTSLPVEAAAPYCNRILYQFAFWRTSVVWFILFILISFIGHRKGL